MEGRGGVEDASVMKISKKEGCRIVKGLKKEEQDCVGDRVFNRESMNLLENRLRW